MKILQVNCVWKTGSTGKILQDISMCLKNHNIDSVICYGRGKKTSEKNVYKVSSEFGAKTHSLLTKLFGVRFGHSFFATRKLISIIKKEKPDLVHLHCLNCNFTNVYKLLNFLKIKNIPTVLTLHAEIMHTAGCDYAFDCEKWKTGCYDCKRVCGLISSKFRDDAKYCYERMQKAFSGFENIFVTGVSEWVTERAKLSPIFSKKTVFTTVHNGIDTKTFNYTESSLREKLNISKDKKIILFVTSGFSHPIKGGKYVLELAKLLPEVQFIIVGFDDDKSILPKNVLPVCHTNDRKELAEYYSLADVTLLTSKKETFSVIVAESLCCGTPVVGFKAGAPETIAIKEYSSFVEQGDILALKKTCEEFLSNTYDKVKISTQAIEKYNRELMSQNYLEAYKKCIENRKKKILQVNCVFKKGSTGKIVYDISEGIKNSNMQSIVCYGRGQRPQEKDVYKVSSEFGAKIHSFFAKLFGVQFGHSFFATRRLISIIKKENPDVVHLHCLNANFTNVYKLLNFLKAKNIPTVLTLHAEIMHTAGCEHAMECEKWKTQCSNCPKIKGKISRFFRDDAKYCFNRMQKAMKGFNNLVVVGVSKWITERAKLSAVFPKGTRFCTVNNGIDTDSFHYVKAIGLRERLNIPKDKKIVLHVTPNFNHEIKGGKYVLELARRLPEVQFIIVGFNGNKNILPQNILPIAHTNSKKELAEYYSLADCFVCTSLRENYPTVCLEATACGCNVVAFDSGGIRETIPKNHGECVPCYEIDKMEAAVRRWIQGDNQKNEKTIETLSYRTMSSKYIDLYNTFEGS